MPNIIIMPPKSRDVDFDEEDTTFRILPLYRRRCDQMSIHALPHLRELLQDATKFEAYQTEQAIGPIQVRALMESLLELRYTKLKVLKIWRGKIGDEGVRNICNYLEATKENRLQVLDLLENQISELGCQFLGKCFVQPFIHIKHLKLDDNLIGVEGLKNLSVGLRVNPSITKLSLKYCGITEEGVRFLQDILANISSSIRSLKLQGNHLNNPGIYQLLRAVEINEVLDKINLADTGLNLLGFTAKKTICPPEGKESRHEIPQSRQSKGDNQSLDNPEKNERETSINNVKQVIPIDTGVQVNRMASKKVAGKSPSTKIKSEQVEEAEKVKFIRQIAEDDMSQEGHIMRMLCGIMSSNMILKKYDLRFNPISDDAAHILFEIIQDNGAIKDVEFNNNVDAELREILDTLMRRRTGRMPKGRGRGGKRKKK